MRIARGMLLLVGLLTVLAAAWAEEADPRLRFHTPSFEAALALGQAMRLADRQPTAALAQFDAALALDPACAYALLARGALQEKLGSLDDATASYKGAVTRDRWQTDLGVHAALDLGILYGKLKQYDDSAAWLSLALLHDPDNRFGWQWSAYRNLAVTHGLQNHYGAALVTALLARTVDAEKTEEQFVASFQAGKKETSARVLRLPEPTLPALPAHAGPKAPFPVTCAGAAITEPLAQLLTESRGTRVLAIPKEQPFYYLIETEGDRPTVTQVPVDAPIVTAVLADDALYVAQANPARIVQLDIATGKPLLTVKTGTIVPTSLAVFPRLHRAYFPGAENIVGVDLRDGTPLATQLPGVYVAAHPSLDYLYTLIRRDPEDDTLGDVLTGPTPLDYPRFLPHTQTTLVRAAVTSEGVSTVELRAYTEWDAERIVLSADGRWLSVLGPDFYPPGQHAENAGTEVFSTVDLSKSYGIFATFGHPLGCAYNPVTGVLTTVRVNNAVHYALVNGDQEEGIQTYFDRAVQLSGSAVWSGSGKYLFLARAAGGLHVWGMFLSAADRAAAREWWKALPAMPAAFPVADAPAAPDPQPVAAVAAFLPTADPAAITALLTHTMKEGCTRLPVAWRTYPPYHASGETAALLNEAATSLGNAEARGVLLFRLKQADAKENLAPLHCLLGEYMRANGQADDALTAYARTLAADAGRTSLSLHALQGCAVIFTEKKDTPRALSCLACAWGLDRANPATLEALAPLLAAPAYADAAALVGQTRRAMLPAVNTLPRLVLAPDTSKTFTPEALYARAVESVVLITADAKHGTGFCLGQPDLVVTEATLVGGAATVQVTPFTCRGGKAWKLDPITADVVFTAPAENIAVLKLRADDAPLTPLPLSADPAQVGMRIYAMGSPEWGKDVLAQTLRDGIVGAIDRQLDGLRLLQHTVAVNPGDGGGPLLDEHGQVIGVMALHGTLDKVGFALPAARLRELLTP